MFKWETGNVSKIIVMAQKIQMLQLKFVCSQSSL